MNDELITINEVLNSGQNIYLYKNETLNLWTTWGYSAYLLSNMDGIKCLTSFSDKMQMPCTCITATNLEGIFRNGIDSLERKEEFYLLSVKEKVDADAYQNWVASLK